MNSGAQFQASQVTSTQLCCQLSDIMDMDGELTLALLSVLTYCAKHSLHLVDLWKKRHQFQLKNDLVFFFLLSVLLKSIAQK